MADDRRGSGDRARDRRGVRARHATARRRRAAAVPSAHVPARHRAGRAVRRRRPDDRVRRGVGRPSHRALLDAAGGARGAVAADDRHRAVRHLVEGRDGSRAASRAASDASRARSRERRSPADCRVSSPRACSPRTGRPTALDWPSRNPRRPRRARVSDRQDALRSEPRHTSRTSASRRPAMPSRSISHPVSGDTAGSVVLVDLQGQARDVLSSGWNSVLGLAWSPSATRSGSPPREPVPRRPFTPSPATGKERLLLAAPATLTLHDVSRDGRALVSRDAWGAGVMAMTTAGSDNERDLSWLDGSTAWDVSADGSTTIIEEGMGGRRRRAVDLSAIAPTARLRCAWAKACRSRCHPTSSGCYRHQSPPISSSCFRPASGSRRRCPAVKITSLLSVCALAAGWQTIHRLGHGGRPSEPRVSAVDRRWRSAGHHAGRRIRPSRDAA